jgi:hypothetical protein
MYNVIVAKATDCIHNVVKFGNPENIMEEVMLFLDVQNDDDGAPPLPPLSLLLFMPFVREPGPIPGDAPLPAVMFAEEVVMCDDVRCDGIMCRSR